MLLVTFLSKEKWKSYFQTCDRLFSASGLWCKLKRIRSFLKTRNNTLANCKEEELTAVNRKAENVRKTSHKAKNIWKTSHKAKNITSTNHKSENSIPAGNTSCICSLDMFDSHILLYDSIPKIIMLRKKSESLTGIEHATFWLPVSWGE